MDCNSRKQKNMSLNKTLSYKDILVLAFSTMIGWGWVVLAGTWVSQGGGIGAAVAFLIGAILCVFVGLTYCELTPMLPYAGGELVFSYKAMGYNASWLTGWMITFAYLGVAAWEGPALATAIDYIISIPKIGYLWTVMGFEVYFTWLIIPAFVGGFLIVTNFRGMKFSALFQSIVTGILALGGIIFVIISIVKGELITNAEPMFTTSKGLFSVVLAVPAMFVGFDVIPQAAEEMNVSLKKIPKAIILSICLAATWYIAIVLSAFIASPQRVLQQDGITIANAINYVTGSPLAGKLIIITAIMGILTSWNGFIIGATRVLFSMGRARMLPKIFSSLHNKYKTPYFSTIFVGLITVFSPLLGKNSLGWFVNSSAFGTVIAYFMVALSFLVLRVKEPFMERPYKVKHGKLVGIIAIAITLFFIVLYLPIGSSSLSKIEWMIVFLWIMVGILLYLINLPKKHKYKLQREEMMFGKNETKEK